MNRTSFLPAAAACVLGAAGAVLRQAHTRTCYEDSGFILPHHPLTGLLTGVLIAVILLGVITAAVISVRGKKAPADASAGPCPPVCCIVSGLLTAAGAVWQFADLEIAVMTVINTLCVFILSDEAVPKVKGVFK